MQKWIGVATLSLLLVGCGSPAHEANTGHPVASSHSSHAVTIGATTVSTGSVWILNDPGSGLPRESLTIETIHGARITATLYLGEFGSLIQANIAGTVHAKNRLTLSGLVQESTASGSTAHHPIHLTLQSAGPKAIWVSQRIAGDLVNSFGQVAFHRQ